MSATATVRGSRSQKMAALATANLRRSDWAELKLRMRADGRRGGLLLADVLLHDRQRFAGMDIGPVLLGVPLLGRERIRRFLDREHISVWCEVGALTDRRARVIAAMLVEHARTDVRGRQGLVEVGSRGESDER